VLSGLPNKRTWVVAFSAATLSALLALYLTRPVQAPGIGSLSGFAGRDHASLRSPDQLMPDEIAYQVPRDRIKAIKSREAPEDALQAAKDIDRRLLQDNAKAVLADPAGNNIFRFPGRENATKMEFGPVSQAGFFQGVPIKVGGENDPVPVHLEDGKDKHIVLARRSLAKDIAQHLFTSVVRVEGTGRWIRHTDGEWEMLSFHATSFKLIEDADIRKNISELRKVPGEWKKLDDPLAELEQIRRGMKLQ